MSYHASNVTWLTYFRSSSTQKGLVVCLQSESIEKCQFELCSKQDREHDFGVRLV